MNNISFKRFMQDIKRSGIELDLCSTGEEHLQRRHESISSECVQPDKRQHLPEIPAHAEQVQNDNQDATERDRFHGVSGDA